MAVHWHEQYEQRFAPNRPPWTVAGTFVAVVRAAFARYGFDHPTDPQTGEVWTRIQDDHDAKQLHFQSCGRLNSYIQRIARNLASDLRDKTIAANRRLSHRPVDELPTLPALEQPDTEYQRVKALAVPLLESIDAIRLPDQLSELRRKLAEFGPPKSEIVPDTGSDEHYDDLTPERIERRVKLLHWYGSDDTLLAYYLHLRGCQGKEIAKLLGSSEATVTRRLKVARALFCEAQQAVLRHHAGGGQ